MAEAETEDRPTRCSGCGSPFGGGVTVEITLHRGDAERTTVLCEECAAVACGSCASRVPVASALLNRGDIWEETKLYDCGRCEDSVTGSQIVELRHESDPSYRKRICEECLQDIPIPANIRVVRDVS